MRNKLQIEDIKNNIDEIYNRLKSEDTGNKENETIKELINDLERITVRLLEAC